MPSEQLRFWLETGASIIGLIGVFAIALELLRARRADERDFLFHTYEKFEDISNERRMVSSLEFSNWDELILINKDVETRKVYWRVFNFWDLLTKTVRANAIDKNIAFEHFGFTFLTYYDKHSHIFAEIKEIKGGVDIFESFDWFFKEVLKVYPDELDGIKRHNEYVDKVIAQAS